MEQNIHKNHFFAAIPLCLLHIIRLPTVPPLINPPPPPTPVTLAAASAATPLARQHIMPPPVTLAAASAATPLAQQHIMPTPVTLATTSAATLAQPPIMRSPVTIVTASAATQLAQPPITTMPVTLASASAESPLPPPHIMRSPVTLPHPNMSSPQPPPLPPPPQPPQMPLLMHPPPTIVDISSNVAINVARQATMYSSIRVEENTWNDRIQDTGCKKEELTAKTYRQNQIVAYGPKDDDPVFYYDLSCIAIDIIKAINASSSKQEEWPRFPKNKTDVKLVIIKHILETRTMTMIGDYELKQTLLLQIINKLWGPRQASQTTVDNDKLRLFGVLFLEQNTEKLYRLHTGPSKREHFDDPAQSCKGIYNLLCLDFNNNDLKVEMPEKALDVNEYYDDLNPNDESRIRITRDCTYITNYHVCCLLLLLSQLYSLCLINLTGKWVKKVYETTMTEYKAILNLWFEGTGGGSGETSMFQSWSEEKLDKYDIDPTVYDHTDISSRPSILIDGYAKHKKYLTMIFLWDERKDYILASKYNPINIGMGEAGIPIVESTVTTPSRVTGRGAGSKSPHKVSKVGKSTPEEEAKKMMETVMNLMMERSAVEAKNEDDVDTSMEKQPISELIKLHDMYIRNLTLHQENNTLTDKKKVRIMKQIDDIFEIIEDRTAKKKRKRDKDCDSDIDTVS